LNFDTCAACGAVVPRPGDLCLRCLFACCDHERTPAPDLSVVECVACGFTAKSGGASCQSCGEFWCAGTTDRARRARRRGRIVRRGVWSIVILGPIRVTLSCDFPGCSEAHVFVSEPMPDGITQEARSENVEAVYRAILDAGWRVFVKEGDGVLCREHTAKVEEMAGELLAARFPAHTPQNAPQSSAGPRTNGSSSPDP